MADDITFLDIACLMKISDDTTLERFGSSINASIFDASNIAGTLKQKDLIDFTSIFPGPNSIAVTENGKAVLLEAEQRAATPFDNLDKSILSQIASGKSSPKDIQSSISLNSRDLGMRLYKLSKQNFLTYELKSGQVDILLTEQGFLKASPQQTPQQQPHASYQTPPVQQTTRTQAQTPIPGIQQPVQQEAATPAPTPTDPQQPIQFHGKPLAKKKAVVVAFAIIILIVVLYILVTMKII